MMFIADEISVFDGRAGVDIDTIHWTSKCTEKKMQSSADEFPDDTRMSHS